MIKSFHVCTALLLVALLHTSCSRIVTGIYGIRQPAPVSEADVYASARRHHIPVEDCYELDKSFLRYLFSLDSAQYAVQIQNHYQPLKVLYYNKQGQLQSFHANCYAGGFPNLTWNKAGAFDVFIPKQQAPLDSIFSLEKHMHFLRPLSKTQAFTATDYDVVVLAFWNKHMGRQSKRLVRLVQQNAALAGNQRVKLLYVNNDNVEAATMLK